MTPYPKHYLAGVPHDLRMRVLDLCVHRQWHDALDLLHQNGFTQYEWWEVVWFHDHAPTNLDLVGRSVPAEPLSIPDSEISNSESEIVPSCGHPPSDGPSNPEPLALTPPCSSVPSASSVLNDPPVKPKRRRPRSKACRLPAEVQLTLNTMLAGGCRYRDIIRSLNTRGHPGFNKANLNAWKRTGFQNWLRKQNLPALEDVQKVGARCAEARKVSEDRPQPLSLIWSLNSQSSCDISFQGSAMNEGALQLWDGVLFRQRPDLTFESISPQVQEWTGLEPHLSWQAIHPADRAKAELDQATIRLRHARTWQVTWVEQRRRAIAAGYEGYWENVTGRIHLSQELAQTHWKATLGAATQRLVHDFNNLLTGILSLSDAYLLRLLPDNPAREGMQLINQNARQAADIVHHIGGLFRDKPGRRSYENLAHVATGAADMLRRVLPKYSTLKLDCKQETVPVYVDPIDLRQVVVSLGLALTPPINLEVGLEKERAYLTIAGVALAASAAQLIAEGFAERNEARFKAESNSFKLDFRVTDFTDAERRQRSVLLISDASDEAVRIAEALRRNGHEAVIGPEQLLRLADYRFDAVAALPETSGSLSRSPDVVFSKGMSENEMLAAVSAFFSERL